MQDFVMNVEKIRQILPHRYPMLLVDRVMELRRNTMIVSQMDISRHIKM